MRSRPSWAPALTILLVAPWVGEVLSTSTPPLDLLVPWILVLQAALYGCGALICREVARRSGFGLLGLCLLAAAYAVYEEALIVQSWFDPDYQHDVGLDGYSRVWDTNLLLATHLTSFHVAVSIGSSVLLVERLFPAYRDRAWADRRGLVLAALALFVVVPFTYGDPFVGPVAQKLLAIALGALLVLAAFVWGRRPAEPPGRRRVHPHPRLLAPVAFAGTGSHFLLVYAMPSTGLRWPLGLAVALAPIVIGVLLVRRWASGDEYGRDALRVITGMLGFFVALDAVVGLGGRYDMIVGALATAGALWWLARRTRPVLA